MTITILLLFVTTLLALALLRISVSALEKRMFQLEHVSEHQQDVNIAQSAVNWLIYKILDQRNDNQHNMLGIAKKHD